MSDRLVCVAVPVAVDRGFTYRLPDTVEATPGSRVLVPFGARAMVGVVRPVPAKEDVADEKLKPIWGVLDVEPSLPADVLALCEWIADYYLAPVGEVYRLALPGMLTHADARVAAITEAGAHALETAGAPLLGQASHVLDDRERRVLEFLREAGPGGVGVSRLTRKDGPKVSGVLVVLAQLQARGLCETRWDDEQIQSRTETHLRRTDLLRGTGADEDALQRIVGRSKQRRALLDELEARRFGPGGSEDEEGDGGWVPISELRSPFPRVRQLLSGLIEAKLVVAQERPRSLDPFEQGSLEPSEPRSPTADQAAALNVLGEALDARQFASHLLHGITGSGKTEVYLQLIARARAQRRGAIVLVPEIALTPQLSDRFRARFGDEVAVLHSALTPRQRLDAWQQIHSGLRPIVIGARSAIFAPVPDLGVVVVDEEHDPSFKQEEGVRYNARDVALVRARDDGAVVVLGSATPALETWDLAQRGRHVYLQLRTRPTARPLPQVQILPLSVHRPDPDSLLTAALRSAIQDVVAAGEQAIVFLNRRGFTTTMVCETCGSLQQCPDCSAPSMTYHLSRNRLMCHLCGHLEAAPKVCRSCGADTLCHGGVGTERVEMALERELEGLRVLRLDRDVARGRRLLDTLAAFRRHEADVLVGTQMLSKGHDFPGVTLVGILQGDHGLALPDPRAAERTFQLLTQVAGRAGRGERAGRVIVQAWAVEHPAITFAAHHDYVGFAQAELGNRAALGNPPAGYLALLRVHGLDEDRVRARITELASFLRRGVDKVRREHPEPDPELPPVLSVLGPVPSPIAKINRRSRWQVLLRGRQRAPLRWILEHVRPRLGTQGSGAVQTVAVVDVDPQSLL